MTKPFKIPSSNWHRTRVSEKLGLTYPIIQGPLGGFASQRLTAAVSNFGGMGSFGAHGLEPAAIRDVIGEIRGLTSRPFAMNLWVSMEDEGAFSSDATAFARALAPLAPHLQELGAPLPVFKPYGPIRFEDQVRVLLDAKVAAFSFIFGIPPREILDECRRQNIVTIGAATTVDEAIALEQAGVEVIAASGFEAGGHRGAFLRNPEASLTGTFSLVPQVSDAVGVPVIAAGGVADARGVVAALVLGAEAVQMGTAFLGCEESGANAYHRETILSGKAGKTALARGFTGRLARGVENQLMEDLNQPGIAILPYPLQRALVKNLSAAAERAGRAELLPMWAGQSASLSRCDNVTEFLQKLVDGANALTSSGSVGA